MMWSSEFNRLSDSDKRFLLDAPIDLIEKAAAGDLNYIKSYCKNEKLASLLQSIRTKDLNLLIEIFDLTSEADNSDYPRDIELYKRIIDIAPWDSISVMSIGSSYWNIGDKQQELQWMEKAHSIDPDNDRISSNLQGIKSHM